MRMTAARTYLVATLLALTATAGGQWVEDSIDVGGVNVSGLVYNQRAGVVYGRCYYGHTFFAIACSTNELVSQIPLTYPIATAYNSSDNRAYCTFSYHGEDSVLVVDGSTHTRIKAVRVDGAYLPVWDRISDRLYITCFDYDEVAVYDCLTDSVVARIPVPGEPVGLTINSRRRKLYVQNDADMTVSIVDMTTNQVIRNVYVGSYFFAGCYSEVGDKYYCDGADGIAVVDGIGDTLLCQVSLPQGYSLKDMVAVDAESLVLAATFSGVTDSCFAIDVVRDSIVVAVQVGRPRALTYSVTSHLVYCANGSTWDNLSVITGDGTRVIGLVPVGDGPQSLAVCPQWEKLYVGHAGMTSRVYVVRDRVGGIEESERKRVLPAVVRASPNPFRTSVNLELRLPAACDELLVYATTGRLVRHVKRDNRAEGTYEWDGRDELGVAVPAGVYIATGAGKPAVQVRLVKLR